MPLGSAVEVAKELAPMLLPLIPYFVKGIKEKGKEFSKKLAEEGGEQAVNLAERIWSKLKPKLDKTDEAKQVVESASQEPLNEAKLTEALSAILEDSKLRSSISELMDEGKKKHLTISSYLKAGEIYGKVTGAEIRDVESLGQRNFRAHLETGKIGKGANVKGLVIGNNEQQIARKKSKEKHHGR